MEQTIDFAVLDQAIKEFGNEEKSLIAILQRAQENYRYLPREIFPYLAEKLSLSEAKIYGVATFYSQFSLVPKGKFKVEVCMGTACYVKGAGQILDKFSEILGIKPGETSSDGLFTLDALRCIGACGIAPAVTINGKVYPKMTVDQVPGVVKEYLDKEGK